MNSRGSLVNSTAPILKAPHEGGRARNLTCKVGAVTRCDSVTQWEQLQHQGLGLICSNEEYSSNSERNIQFSYPMTLCVRPGSPQYATEDPIMV